MPSEQLVSGMPPLELEVLEVLVVLELVLDEVPLAVLVWEELEVPGPWLELPAPPAPPAPVGSKTLKSWVQASGVSTPIATSTDITIAGRSMDNLTVSRADPARRKASCREATM